MNPKSIDWIKPDPSVNCTVFVSDPSRIIDRHKGGVFRAGESMQEGWEMLKKVLERIGAEVVEVSTEDTPSRAAYTRDPVTQIGPEKFISGRQFTRKSYTDDMYIGGKAETNRQFAVEQSRLIKNFMQIARIEPADFKKRILEFDDALHGGNVIVDEPQKRIFLGYDASVKEEIDADTQKQIHAIETFSGYRVIPVAVTGSIFYHLDTLLGVDELTHKAYFYPEGTDKQSAERLRKEFGEALIEITRNEALLSRATNFICVGRYIVLTNDNSKFENRLLESRAEDTIITPHKCGVDSFQITSGGVRCLTNIVQKPTIPSIERHI